MAHIQLPIAEELGREFPGILGPMTFRPETAAPLNERPAFRTGDLSKLRARKPR
jgi:hypothetical protein